MPGQSINKSALNKCYRLLALRPRTEFELRHKLLRSGFTVSVTDDAMAELKKRGLVNDALFAREWLRWRIASKEVGREFLKAELRHKGVDRQIIELALLEYDDDQELEQAIALVQKKIKQRGRGLTWRQLAGFLTRRGFSWDILNKVYNLLSDIKEIDIS